MTYYGAPPGEPERRPDPSPRPQPYGPAGAGRPVGRATPMAPVGRAAVPASPAPVRPGSTRRLVGRRTAILLVMVGVLVVGAGTAFATGVFSGGGRSAPVGGPAPSGQASSAGTTAAAPKAAAPPAKAAGPISLSATGDIIMGNAPRGLPPNGGKGFFDPVRSALDADLQMGNLEQTLTEATGSTKCAPGSRTCYAFRTPPSYATVLRDAGFDLMNMANNHAYDFGAQGYKNTQAALDAAGIRYAGAPDQITVVEVKGVKVAVVGFASYPTWSNDVTRIDSAAALVKRAAGQADLVVVQVHMGAEGAGMTHVRPGVEMFLGENRGDPIAFSHAVVDAGADLVVGHGPHVMRGIEFHKGRLIAYSLGNFAGYESLGIAGVTGVGGVLKVTLNADGSYVSGTLAPTVMVEPGLPRPDSSKRAITLVGGLSKADFPTTGAKIGADGTITP
ncbi:MAG TPA: CapA family protein [Micromonosporaceae bacterium]|nr:CapA family protein [Micromonosporaceae bacterium]